MSAHSGPMHSDNCLAKHMNDAACHSGCQRANWLDEPVPRWQARAELLRQLEGWAREQRTFESSDVDRLRHHPMFLTPSGRVFDALAAAADTASSIIRTTYERVAVSALSIRRECDARENAASRTKARADAIERTAESATSLPPRRTDDQPVHDVVTISVQEQLL